MPDAYLGRTIRRLLASVVKIDPSLLKLQRLGSHYIPVSAKKKLRGLDVSQEVYELCQVTFRSYSKTALLRNSELQSYLLTKTFSDLFTRYNKVLSGFEIILPEDLF